MRVKMRIALACVLVALGACWAGTASAMTIGATGPGSGNCTRPNIGYFGDAFSVVPPGGGLITSFSFRQTLANFGQRVDFLVLRNDPTQNGGTLGVTDVVIGKTGVRTLGLSVFPTTVTFPASIPVRAGDFLAIWTDGLDNCLRAAQPNEYIRNYIGFAGYPDPAVGDPLQRLTEGPSTGDPGGRRLNLSATLAQPAFPPAATLNTPPAPPATYTQNQSVTASYSCQAGSGSTLSSCTGTTPNGATVDTATLGTHTFTVTAIDADTQQTTVTHTYNVVAPPPAGPPSVTLSTPANGAAYAQNSSVTASYSCAPGANGGVLRPGTAGCSGSLPSGAQLDTSTPGQYSFAVTATDTDGQAATVTATYRVTAPAADTTPPACNLTSSGTNALGQNWIQITTQDSQSGIKTIEVVAKSNTLDDAPSFTVGTTSPVQVRANGVVPLSPVMMQIKVTDVAGNSVVCDPVAQLSLNVLGAPTSQTFTGIAQSEHLVHIRNGNPGSSGIDLNVNGAVFHAGGLAANEQRTVDIASALRPGTANTVTVTASGPPLSTTLITIADS